MAIGDTCACCAWRATCVCPDEWLHEATSGTRSYFSVIDLARPEPHPRHRRLFGALLCGHGMFGKGWRSRFQVTLHA
eukprot:4270369-Prymnesium_polylepis.4